MQRFIKWLGRSFSTQNAAPSSRRPTVEELEPRLAPAVTMYPQIRPENSIASEARNVSMPKRTTFGPALWGTESIAKADALIGQAL